MKILILNKRKRTLRSFFTGRPAVIQTDYNHYRQTVYLYSQKMIRKASAPWFNFSGCENIAGSMFSLLHLTGK